MVLSWVTSATAGHTKKLATNAIFLVGYALGQILCTQFWKDKYAPKFVVPWVICLVSRPRPLRSFSPLTHRPPPRPSSP
jgi:MFS transporter, ACS family, allantoate permease